MSFIESAVIKVALDEKTAERLCKALLDKLVRTSAGGIRDGYQHLYRLYEKIGSTFSLPLSTTIGIERKADKRRAEIYESRNLMRTLKDTKRQLIAANARISELENLIPAIRNGNLIF